MKYLIVRETIHHGDYHNVREQTAAATWMGMMTLLNESPYNAGHDEKWYATNEYVLDMVAKLLTGKRAEFGWADYEVVEK